nr:uncharacterized protein LOC123275985 [Equus asinus]
MPVPRCHRHPQPARGGGARCAELSCRVPPPRSSPSGLPGARRAWGARVARRPRRCQWRRTRTRPPPPRGGRTQAAAPVSVRWAPAGGGCKERPPGTPRTFPAPSGLSPSPHSRGPGEGGPPTLAPPAGRRPLPTATSLSERRRGEGGGDSALPGRLPSSLAVCLQGSQEGWMAHLFHLIRVSPSSNHLPRQQMKSPCQKGCPGSILSGSGRGAVDPSRAWASCRQGTSCWRGDSPGDLPVAAHGWVVLPKPSNARDKRNTQQRNTVHPQIGTLRARLIWSFKKYQGSEGPLGDSVCTECPE